MTYPEMPSPDVYEGLRALQGYCYANAVSKGFHADGDALRAALDHCGNLDSMTDAATYELLRTAERNMAGNRLMLIVGEVAEAHEELRKGLAPDEEYVSYPAPPASFTVDFSSGQEATEAWEQSFKKSGLTPKPEGVPSEIADIVIRCLDFAAEHEIDLATVIANKLVFNAQRAAMHGGKRF